MRKDQCQAAGLYGLFWGLEVVGSWMAFFTQLGGSLLLVSW